MFCNSAAYYVYHIYCILQPRSIHCTVVYTRESKRSEIRKSEMNCNSLTEPLVLIYKFLHGHVAVKRPAIVIEEMQCTPCQRWPLALRKIMHCYYMHCLVLFKFLNFSM